MIRYLKTGHSPCLYSTPINFLQKKNTLLETSCQALCNLDSGYNTKCQTKRFISVFFISLICLVITVVLFASNYDHSRLKLNDLRPISAKSVESLPLSAVSISKPDVNTTRHPNRTRRIIENTRVEMS